MKLAAELAAEEINAKGGVDGRPLELLIRDDFANPDSAVYIATDLKSAGVAAVVGHLWSGTTIAAAPVYNGGDDAVVAISPSSSAPAVSAAGPWTFRLCPSDLEHGAALARWIRNDLGLERGAVLYLNDEYGRGVRQTFATEFTRLRGTLVAIDPYLGDNPDVAVYLDRLAKQGGAQFLVVAGNRGDAEVIIREARRRNLNVPVLGADGLEAADAGRAYLVHVPPEFLRITEQPASQAVDVRGTAVFHAAAVSSVETIAWQWRKDGVPLMDGGDVSGATTDTLTIGDVAAADAGEYDCELSIGVCTKVTAAATLTVVCLADFAPPYGLLNLFDLLAFQTAYGNEDPAADLGAPFGVINLFDFLAFQTYFGYGCE